MKTFTYDVDAQITETAIHDRLVDLGWTPPPTKPRDLFSSVSMSGEEYASVLDSLHRKNTLIAELEEEILQLKKTILNVRSLVKL